MHSLPLFVRLADRPVILLGVGEAADAKRRLLERAGARIVGADADAQLAFVAIEDDGEALTAIAALKARGILVNATDRPAHCDFTLPAIVDRDPVLVAIGTGGASAGLAKALRIALEGLLPPTLGQLATTLSTARDRIRSRWPDPRERRLALDAALAGGGALDPLAGVGTVESWLAHGSEGEGGLIAITLRSDDPDDLTVREARLLGRADRIVHRPDVPSSILDRARADAVRIPGEAPPAVPGAGLTLWIERQA